MTGPIEQSCADPLSWRRRLGHQVATAYAREPNVVATMIAGSVGRGSADQFSDLEIDVYYHRAPTTAERTRAAQRSGGKLLALAQDEQEWEEQLSFGGFPVTTSTSLVSTMEDFLDQVTSGAIALEAQTRLSSLLHSAAVTGCDLIATWRQRAQHYPEVLGQAMLTENIPILTAYGPQEQMLAERSDLVRFYRRLAQTGRAVIGVLLGLNHIYAPSPDHDKGIAELIETMAHVPEGLTDRLRSALSAGPVTAVAGFQQIIDDVLALVGEHAPTLGEESDDLATQERPAGPLSRSIWWQPPVGI